MALLDQIKGPSRPVPYSPTSSSTAANSCWIEEYKKSCKYSTSVLCSLSQFCASGTFSWYLCSWFSSVDSLSRNLPSCSSDTLQTICIENITGMSSSTSTALWVKYQHFFIIFGLETLIWYPVAVLGKGFPVHLQSSVEGSVAVSFFSLSTFSPDHLFTGWKYL